MMTQTEREEKREMLKRIKRNEKSQCLANIFRNSLLHTYVYAFSSIYPTQCFLLFLPKNELIYPFILCMHAVLKNYH